MARKDQRKPISAVLLSLLCTILNSVCTTSLKIVNHVPLLAKQVKCWFAISVTLVVIAPFSLSAFGECDEHSYRWVAILGDWSAPENWKHPVWDPDLGRCVDMPGVPQADDWASIENGGSAIITGTAQAKAIDLWPGTLIQTGSLNTNLVTIFAGGNFVQTGGTTISEYLCLYNQGTYELHQGSFNVNQVGICGGGTYELRDGSFNANQVHVGVVLGVGGTFVQTGGNITISEYLYVYNQGTYELHQGILNANQVSVHNSGTGAGTFVQTGGNVIISEEFWLDGNGTYELQQGSIDAKDVSISDWGTFVQTGGNVTISEYLSLYDEGIYELLGGTLSVDGVIAVGGIGISGGLSVSDGIGIFVNDEGIINGITQDSTLWVFGSGGSLTGPGTFNIEVVYESDEIYGTSGYEGVAISFLPNCLTEGGAFSVTQITPDDFAGGNVPNLLESSVFDVSFDGSFCGEFTITIPYVWSEVDALGVDETSLVILQETGPGTYERLDDITVDGMYGTVSAKAHTFGTFAVAYVPPVLIPGDLLLGEGAKIVPGPWSHIGMYIGNGQVVESHIALGGVAITPIESWFERYKTWAVLRVVSADNGTREKAIEWATHPDRFDDPYDLMWWQKDPDGEAWYCSEFIWAAYYNASNGQINLEYHGPWEFLEGGITPYEILLDEETVVIAEHYEDTTRKGLVIVTKSPVDLKVIDPGNFSVSKQLIEVPEAIYGEDDIDGDGNLEDWVGIPERRIGTYFITVVPEPNASPDDTYSLELKIDDQTMVLAKDVRIQDIPTHPYKVESKLCYSDFDGDGDVDFADYAMFASHWMNVPCNYPSWCEGTDLDYSGFIDFNDLGIFVDDWLWEKIPADVDIDGNVDFFDYAILANYWMAENCAERNWCDSTDLNKSGKVNILDLTILAEHWLEGK